MPDIKTGGHSVETTLTSVNGGTHIKLKLRCCSQLRRKREANDDRRAGQKILKLLGKEHLQLVQESVEWWESFGETLSLSCVEDDLVGLGVLFGGVGLEGLPVIEDALWEGLSGGGGSELGIET